MSTTADKLRSNYLELIGETIQRGPFKDTWESLCKVGVPTWYKDAKFGIFIHWGVYSVPAFGSEWYPRRMYVEGTPEFEHHVKTYGPHKEFGYADFVPMFKAEHYDPADWAELFKTSGARYVMPVAEHHDGFQMYASDLSDWNAAKMGPRRDVMGDLKLEVESRGMVFSASSHRAENYWFFDGCRTFDSGIKEIEFQEPYGYAHPAYSSGDQEATHDIYSTPASAEHLDDWLARSCELVDKYQPKVVWFDWWIHNVCFKPYLRKFAAYYYNRAREWDHEVAINYKYDAFTYGSAIFDVERGQLSDIRPILWQTDTAVAKNSWGYTENNEFKKPAEIVCDLVDIVSKNGCMLLNIGPRADGTITDEDRSILTAIGDWLRVNGEAIYETRHWVRFGEGPTEVKEGAFTDTKRSAFTSRDIRFTYNGPNLYATVLGRPAPGEMISIECLRNRSSDFDGHIESVELVGSDAPVKWERTKDGLKIEFSGDGGSDMPVCFKIELD